MKVKGPDAVTRNLIRLRSCAKAPGHTCADERISLAREGGRLAWLNDLRAGSWLNLSASVGLGLVPSLAFIL